MSPSWTRNLKMTALAAVLVPALGGVGLADSYHYYGPSGPVYVPQYVPAPAPYYAPPPVYYEPVAPYYAPPPGPSLFFGLGVPLFGSHDHDRHRHRHFRRHHNDHDWRRHSDDDDDDRRRARRAHDDDDDRGDRGRRHYDAATLGIKPGDGQWYNPRFGYKRDDK